MQEGTLKPLQDFKHLPQPSRMDDTLFFVDHTWSINSLGEEGDLLIGATRTGDLFVIEGYDVVQVLPYDQRNNYTCLKSFSGGFVAATDDGHLCFYKHLPEQQQ